MIADPTILDCCFDLVMLTLCRRGFLLTGLAF